MVMFPEKLDSLLREGTESAGVELYHWELSGGEGQGRLLVYIDTADGVTSADCERASRAIERLLDSDKAITSPYTLEVSSPGVERRLYEPWHYHRVVGKEIRVRLHGSHGGQRSVVGRLEGLSGDSVLLHVAGETVELPLAEVARAQVVFEPKREGR
ncbi:MAG: ribosome maturation factor RimP [Candidatus Bipolaricaulota bacterium]